MRVISDEEVARISALYAARVEKQNGYEPGYREKWAELVRQVLVFGGVLVCPPLEPDPDIDAEILGEFFPADLVKKIPGEPSECHQNTSRLWVIDEVETIVTGYALYEDGIWRPHTWGLDEKGTIVETTADWTGYFGVRLDDVDAAIFAFSNMREEELMALVPHSPKIMAIAGDILALEESWT